MGGRFVRRGFFGVEAILSWELKKTGSEAIEAMDQWVVLQAPALAFRVRKALGLLGGPDPGTTKTHPEAKANFQSRVRWGVARASLTLNPKP